MATDPNTGDPSGDSTASTGLLDSILNTGSNVFGTLAAQQTAQNTANKNAAATLAAAQTSSATWTKVAIIGGAALVLVVVLGFVFRGRS